MTDTQNAQDDKAKSIFAGLMTVGAGGAGLVVAGLVLAIDYLLHGEPDQREQLAKAREKRNRAYYDDALAWIEADRKMREAHRKRLREWYGEDTETRGDRPTADEDGPGRVARWFWSWLIVGAGRAKRGWKKGREKARQQREAGQEKWWKVKDPAQPGTGPTEQPQAEAAPAGQADEQIDLPLVDPDEVVDAEIIEDPEPAAEKAGPEPGAAAEFGERLERLQAEAAETLSTETEPTARPALL